jgi:hypothetical protein
MGVQEEALEERIRSLRGVDIHWAARLQSQVFTMNTSQKTRRDFFTDAGVASALLWGKRGQ